MLETIREFALEQLVASGEEARVREAHADWCRDAAIAWRAQVWGRGQAAAQAAVADESANMRAALEWLLAHGELPDAAALVVALVDFWYLRSQLREATEWLERVFARTNELPAPLAAAITSRLATFLDPQGETTRALSLAECAVQMQRQLRASGAGDAWELAFALFVLGVSQENPEQCLATFSEALTLFRALGDMAWIGHTLTNMAYTEAKQGHIEEAIATAGEAVALQQHHGNAWGAALAKLILAELLRTSGDHAAALRVFQETLRSAQQGEDPWRIASALQCIAAILAASGRELLAARIFGAAARLHARYGAIAEASIWDTDPELADELRAAVGDAAFADAFVAGGEAPIDEIVALALSLRGGSPSPIAMGEGVRG